MSQAVCLIRPKADQDLEEQAIFYATRATPEVGHRFLDAANRTFALLSTHPEIGWLIRLKHPELKNLRLFRVKGFEKILILYRPLADGVEILRVIHGSRNVQALLLREDVT